VNLCPSAHIAAYDPSGLGNGYPALLRQNQTQLVYPRIALDALLLLILGNRPELLS
jgi:hypothetical protein